VRKDGGEIGVTTLFRIDHIFRLVRNFNKKTGSVSCARCLKPVQPRLGVVLMQEKGYFRVLGCEPR